MSNHVVLLSTGKKIAAISLLVLCTAVMSISEAADESVAAIEDIKQVKNELEFQPEDASKTGDEKGFREQSADANVTARVRSSLLWNAETQGM